jgi:thiol-disulfide isomerase/thioredoxin
MMTAARTERGGVVGVLVVALAIAGASACDKGGSSAGAASAESADHDLLGAAAPSFELEAVAGSGSVSPGAHAGKVVIVDFWATWCEPCKASFPYYQSLVDKHGGSVVVLGVSVDEESEGIPAFVQETGARFPIGWDPDQGVAHQYKPPKMPTSYLVDKNGVVRFVHGGFKSDDEATLDAQVESRL